MTTRKKRTRRPGAAMAAVLAALLLSLTAGCGGEPQATAQPSPPQATPAPTPEPDSLSLMVSGEAPPVDSPVLEELQRRAGVRLKVRAVDPEDYTVALQVALSTDSRSDLMEITPAQAYPCRALFVNVYSLFAQYAPDYTAWAREMGLWESLEDQTDWISVFPCHLDHRRIDGGWWVRDDLAGLSDPEALLSSGSPGLSVPGGVRGLLEQVAPLFGTPAGLSLSQGQPVYGPATEAFRKALTWLNDCYASGALDRAFSVRTDASWKNLVASGQPAVVMADFGQWEDLYAAGYTLTSPPLLSDAQPRLKTLSGKSFRFMALSMTCDVPEAAARFLNACFTAEGRLLLNYGLDGVHAHVYGGSAVLTEPWKSAGLTALKAQGLLSPVIPGVRSGEENSLSPELRQQTLSLCVSSMFPQSACCDSPLLRGEAATRRQLLEGQLWPEAQRWWTDFITGDRDPETEWDAYLTALSQAGLDEWVELNS